MEERITRRNSKFHNSRNLWPIRTAGLFPGGTPCIALTREAMVLAHPFGNI